MAPYESDGSLTTNKLTIDDTGGFNSQSEWEAYQSVNSVEIVDGAVQLAEFIPDSGVSRWTFDTDDTDGSTAVDVWGGNDGTIVGATTGATGANQTYTTNEAYSFDGTDDRVRVPDDASLRGFSAFTVSLWVYLDNKNDDRGYAGKYSNDTNNGWYFHYDTSDDIHRFVNYTGTGPNNVPFADSTPQAGVWEHVTLTFEENATAELYSNGAFVADAGVGEFANSSSDMFIGDIADGTFMMDGRIDDVRLYDTALTDSEVSNLHTTGTIQ